VSRELTGRNGKAVGSGEYFKELNRKHFVGELMREETDYYETLRETASRGQDAAAEIYDDLKKHIGAIRYIPKEEREELIKVLRGLQEVCAVTSSGSGRCRDCISILELSDSGTRTRSGAGDREVEVAAKSVKDCGFLTRSSRMELIRKAADWGESCASGDMERVLFLRTLANGRGREFFYDVWQKLNREENPRDFTGRCGRELCSRDYIEAQEQRVFGRSLPSGIGGRSGDRAYGKLLRTSLEELVKEMERDLEQGARDNDYLRDENAERIKAAAKSLERCGVRCYSLERKADDLAWFVGGDADKILELQKALNELGVSERLKEDGVYGRKTEGSRTALLDELMRGTFPTLAWIDPLQSRSTGIHAATKTTKDGRTFSQLVADGNATPLFRADLHPYKGNQTYYHINVDTLPEASLRQRSLAKKLDHAEISKEAYDILKDFRTSGKIIRIAGRVLVVTGGVLDVLELCNTIDDDLHDADRKIGKKTYSAAADIGGSWAGSALGAKFGAWAGAAIGTAILPGVGTAIGGIAGGMILGVAGSFAGSSLGKWVVDITEIGE